MHNCLEIALFLRRKLSNGLRGRRCLREIRTFSFLRRRERSSWGVLVPSLGGRGVPACLLGLLTAWGRLLLLLEDQVIFPSFLFTKFWNFLICLFLTLLNLVSPTLSTKPWHSLSLSVEMIDASWDLHCSSCMATLVRMLFILLILACINSFSAFLIIFLALVVFKVDFSLRLTIT